MLVRVRSREARGRHRAWQGRWVVVGQERGQGWGAPPGGRGWVRGRVPGLRLWEPHQPVLLPLSGSCLPEAGKGAEVPTQRHRFA